MFNKEKTSFSEKGFSSSATLISSGTIFKGDVNSNNDLRIDGTIRGNVICSAKVVIGPSGCVEGNVEGINADITGRIVGNITVKELLQLRQEGAIEGNIMTAQLQIDPTAMFNGKCQMGVQAASVVAMSMDGQNSAEAK